MIYLIVLIILMVVIYYSIELQHKKHKTSLEKDGFVKLGNIPRGSVLKYLPNNYVFIDYIYTIKGCSLSTFHRDVTSSQYIFKTKHPTYTYIRYHNTGPHLSVCPGSHKTTPYLFSIPVTITGKKHDSYLFNCDLVHAGAINSFGKKRYVEQYKIVHQEDLEKLGHLKGIRKHKIGECNISLPYEIFTRKLSIYFSYLSNHILTPYLQKNNNNLVNKIMIYCYGRSFYNM